MIPRWKRYPMGWLSPDGQAFCERGAPMYGGGTAWLIWVRLEDDEVETEGRMAWAKYGQHSDPLRRLYEVADTAETPVPDSPWMRHTNDAGSLFEAKVTAAYAVKQRNDDRVERALRAALPPVAVIRTAADAAAIERDSYG